MSLVYNPKVFDTNNINEAKKIILTNQSGFDTNERWEKETKFLSEDIIKFFSKFNEEHTIIDYGCGIGRLSKEIIVKINCKIIGVDISASMRKMAKEYVSHSNFTAVSPIELKSMLDDGLKIDAAISIWVLQHSLNPIDDIMLLKRSLKENGLFYVLNNKINAIPTNKGWRSNGINIFDLLQSNFELLELSQLPNEVARGTLQTETFIAKLKKN